MTKSFNEVTSSQAKHGNNLVIVDAMNLAFRWKHRKAFDFAADLVRTIASLAKSYEAKHVVVLADWKGSSFRKDFSPDYKGNRKERYANQSEQEAEEARMFFEGYEKALELAKVSYPQLRFKGVEADDVAAYIVKHYSVEYEHVWMISTDRDWDLLLRHNVSRFAYGNRKEFTLDNFYEEHGCDTPEQYIELKVLQGDSGDNVKGIEGVGPKRGYQLIREYGSAAAIWEALPIPGKQKMIQNINNSGDIIPNNYILMDLLEFCEEAINHTEPNNTDIIDKLFEEEFGEKE